MLSRPINYCRIPIEQAGKDIGFLIAYRPSPNDEQSCIAECEQLEHYAKMNDISYALRWRGQIGGDNDIAEQGSFRRQRRLTELSHEPHPEFDIWTKRWHDSALQSLGRWLVGHGISDLSAADVVESIWLYYSFQLAPLWRERIPLAIAVADGIDSKRIALLAPGPGLSEVALPERSELQSELRSIVRPSITANISLDLLVIDSQDRKFAEAAASESRRRDLTHLGVFHDDPRAELETAASTSEEFAGLDQEMLRKKDDTELRRMVVEIKHRDYY